MTDNRDGFGWTTEFTVAKYDADIDTRRMRLARRLNERGHPWLVTRMERRFRRRHQAREENTYQGNLGLNVGFNEIWQLVTGAGGVVFGNTTVLRVGSSSAAEAATQTSVQTSLGSVTVSGAPTFGSQSATWTGSFGAGTATGAWNEWTVENTGGKNLNRKVASMGTKGAGATWTLTLTLTLGN